MIYFTNAFSFNMLNTKDKLGLISFTSLKKADVLLELNAPWISAHGHVDTAAVVSSDLGIEVKPNRINVLVQEGDKVLISQYKGPRLPEGATSLPPGTEIEYLLLQFQVEALNK
jgi:hypothetical protein